MRDDIELRTRMRGIANLPTPRPKLEIVGRRARTLLLRRAATAAVVAGVVGAAIAIPLNGLGGIGNGLRGVGSPGTEAGIVGFAPAEGWAMAASDPEGASWQRIVFVTNGPFAPADLEGSSEEDGILSLRSGTEQTKRGLAADRVLLEVSVVYRSSNPLPPNPDFPERELPLRLPLGPPDTSWEGYSDGLSRYAIGGSVNGRFVAVNVYFGAEQPSDDMMEMAQEELTRLFVEPAPPSVEDIDGSGIALAPVPPPWDGRLYAWASGPPILELSTVPIEDHRPGNPMIPNRDRLASAEDASILLAESDVLDPGYEATSWPISIAASDRCDACEVLDDGTVPPDGHTLFHRAFETGGRSFDLYAEFGAEPDAAGLGALNDLLTRLLIDPSPGATNDERQLELLPGWFEQADPLPAMIDPIIVVAAGSWDFPRRPLIACGDQPALQDLPTDGAFFWIVRYQIDPGEPLGSFRDVELWPDRFTLDLPSSPSDAECAGGTDGSVRQYLLRGGAGRYFQVHIALGPEATDTRTWEVETVLSSFRP